MVKRTIEQLMFGFLVLHAIGNAQAVSRPVDGPSKLLSREATHLPDFEEAGSLFSGAQAVGFELSLPRARSLLPTSIRFGFRESSPLSVVGRGWGWSLPHVSRDARDGLDYATNAFVYFDGSAWKRLASVGADGFVEINGGPARRVRRMINGEGAYFEITDPNGVRTRLGETLNSRIVDPADSSRVFRWNVTSIEDTAGNRVEFSWASRFSTVVLSEIRWDVHADQVSPPLRATFRYSERTASQASFLPGFEWPSRAQLEEIRIEAAPNNQFPPSWKHVESWVFESRPSDPAPILEKIWDVSATGEKRELFRFEYSGGDANFSLPRRRETRVASRAPTSVLVAGDFSQRGKVEMWWAEGDSLKSESGETISLPGSPEDRLYSTQSLTGEVLCYISNGGPLCREGRLWKLINAPWTTPQWTTPEYRRTFRSADLNADGDPDFCAVVRGSFECWISDKTGGFLPFGSLPFSDAETKGQRGRTLELVDANGDRRADPCWVSSGELVCSVTSKAGLSAGNETLRVSLPSLAMLHDESIVRFVQVNLDSLIDFCAVESSGLACFAGTGRGFVLQDRTALPGRAWTDNATFGSAVFLDLDGDNRTDFCSLVNVKEFECFTRRAKGMVKVQGGPNWKAGTLPGSEAKLGPRSVDYIGRPTPTLTNNEGNQILNPAFVTWLELAFSPRATDLDNDGQSELCVRANAEIVECWQTSEKGPFRLSHWKNGEGLLSKISWIVASQTPSSNLHRLHWPLVSKVVSINDDGSTITKSYWYLDGLIDTGTLEFRGFGEVVVREEDELAKTTSTTRIEFHHGESAVDPTLQPDLVGRLRSIESDRGGYSRTDFEYQLRSVPGAANVRAIVPKRVDILSCEGLNCLPPIASATRTYLPKKRLSFDEIGGQIGWTDPPREYGGLEKELGDFNRTPTWRDPTLLETASDGSHFAHALSQPSAGSRLDALRIVIRTADTAFSPPPFPTQQCAGNQSLGLVPGLNESMFEKCLADWSKLLAHRTYDYRVDRYGNVVEEVLTHESRWGSGKLRVERLFLSDETSWILDRPLRVRSFAGNTSSATSEVRFEYDQAAVVTSAAECEATFPALHEGQSPGTVAQAAVPKGLLTSASELVERKGRKETWRIVRIAYDSLGNQRCIQNPSGSVVWSEVDALGIRTLSTKDSMGFQQQIAYSGLNGEALAGVFGEPIRVVDINGNSTSIAYDSFERPVKLLVPGGGEVKFEYIEADAKRGRELRVEVADADVSTWAILRDDFHGRVRWESAPAIDGVARERESVYSAQGTTLRASEWHLPKGQIEWMTAATDNLGRVLRSSSPDSFESRSCWVANDLIEVGSGGEVSVSRFDALGRRTQLTRFENRLSPEELAQFQLQKKRNIAQEMRLDSGQPRWTFPDAMSGLVDLGPCGDESVSLSRGVTSRFDYDGLGRLVRIVGSGGIEQSFEYSPHGEVSMISDSEVGVRAFSFGINGQVRRAVLEDGNEVEYSYDVLGRLTKAEIATAEASEVISYSYDGACANCLGRLWRSEYRGTVEQFAYDAAGRQTGRTLKRGDESLSIVKSYSPLGRLREVRYKDGSKATYSYREGGLVRVDYNGEPVWELAQIDSATRPRRISRGKSESLVHKFHGEGDLECSDQRKLPCGWKLNATSGETLEDVSYEFDRSGGIASRNLAIGVQRWSYKHDLLGRLTSAELGDGRVEEFRLDHSDAILSSRIGHRSFAGSKSRPTRVGDQSVAYDRRGNFSEAVDSAGRKLEVFHDSFGMPQGASWRSGDVTRALSFNPSADGQLVGVESESGAWLVLEGYVTCLGNLCRNYVWLADQILASAPATGSGVKPDRAYYQDFNRTVLVTTNASGGVLERDGSYSFGEPLDSGVELLGEFGLGGSWRVPNFPLQIVGSRLYSPKVEMFLEPDALLGHFDQSQALNRYSYASNDPIGNYDERGLYTETGFGKAVFGVSMGLTAWSGYGVAVGAISATASVAAIAFAAPATVALAIGIVGVTMVGIDMLPGMNIGAEVYSLLDTMVKFTPTNATTLAKSATQAAISAIPSDKLSDSAKKGINDTIDHFSNAKDFSSESKKNKAKAIVNEVKKELKDAESKAVREKNTPPAPAPKPKQTPKQGDGPKRDYKSTDKPAPPVDNPLP